MRFAKAFVVAVLLLLLSVPGSLALMVGTEKVDYLVGDSVNADGVAGAGVANLSVEVYNSTDGMMDSFVVNTTGGSPNYYSFSVAINSSYVPGDYYFTVGDGSSEVSSSFVVLSEFVSVNAHTIRSPLVRLVNTTYVVTGVNNYSSDFSEIFNLSLSGVLRYGSYSNLAGDGKNYSFALVDEHEEGVYDVVYIDRNSTFSKIWKVRHVGEKIAKDVNYTVGEIEFFTGNKLILAPSIEDSSYSAGENVDILVWVKNETHLKGNREVNVSIVDKNGNEVSSKTRQTNSEGYVSVNFTAPSSVGTYFVKVNGKHKDVLDVESFRIVGEITDLAGNPTFSLSSKPKLRVVARVKDLSGGVIKTAIVSALIVYPNGNTASLGTLSFDNNINGYVKEVDLSSESNTGKYKVVITAQYSGNTQEFITGFETESVKLDLIAINPQFIEDAEGPEAMVDSFAPGANVSLMVMLSDFSSGSIIQGGPEEMGLIDIDNESTAVDECETSVTLEDVVDEKGDELNLSLLSYQIINLSRAVKLIAEPGDEGPEQEMLRQCMLIFTAPNKTGVYKTRVRLRHASGDKESIATFSVQKLYAAANPVDFKGDDFWFYAPNSTIKVKLKVTDLLTRAEIPAENITDAKIIEMYKVWPVFDDVFALETYEPNASAANGTIKFKSPDSEGFFMFKFKFKANVAGSEEYGVGNGYFMLKKYMIWGEPQGCEPGKACVASVGDVVNVTVNVADIDKGGMMDLGKSGLSCSDNDNDGLPDCDGLEVSVSELWNDQLMKSMKEGVDYNVNITTIRNSGATLAIAPVNLPTGWYHADLVLTDTLSNDTYFGWAWFEIRNFWVDVMPVNVDESGNLSAGMDKGNTYGAGSSVLFTAMAFDPGNVGEFGPEPLSLAGASLEGLSLVGRNGPPLRLVSGTDYTFSSAVRKVSMPWEPENAPPKDVLVMNLTLLINKTGQYAANVRVTTSGGDSDVGELWFDVSQFDLVLTHNGGEEEWLTTFDPGQVAEINVSAYDFEGNPVNLSQNATKIRSLWSEKTKRPIKPPENSTSVVCVQNNCTLSANLSMIVSGKGRYDMEMQIVDADGNTKEHSIFFETRSIIVSIPNIKEIWINDKDTGKRELDLRNDRDRCDNNLWLNFGCNPISNYCTGPIDVSSNTVNNVTDAGVYCIESSGEWREGLCQGNTGIAIASNSTHIAYNTSCNDAVTCVLTGSLLVGDVFSNGNWNWTVVSIGNASAGQNQFRVKNSAGICGEIDGPQMASYVMVPPANSENDTTLYHGYISNMIGNLQWGGGFAERFPDFNDTRDVYIYHNTTHVWMTNSTNLSVAPAYAVNDVVTDPYGGKWVLDSINRNRVILRGQNVLADTGAFINLSLSKSGVVKLAAVEEKWLGSWDKQTGEEIGVDVNGDGQTNSIVYFALSDAQYEGVYDTLFYSTSNNFSDAIAVSGTRAERTFGDGVNLTLLSISPDAKMAMVYGEKTGDWGNLGELKIGTNVTIPVIVRSPTGQFASANVSVEIIRARTGSVSQDYESVQIRETINGIGEIKVNLSDATGSVSSGKYVFGLGVDSPGAEKEVMEEWMWPFVVVRSFLADSYVGDGGYIAGFRKLPITRYREDTYGYIPVLYTINDTPGSEITGVFLHADNQEMCAITPPADADAGNFSVVKAWQPYEADNYYGIDATNQTVYTNPAQDCDFTDGGEQGPLYAGDSVNLTFGANTYMLEILEIRTAPNYNRTVIGVSGLDASVVEPLSVGEWNSINGSVGNTLSPRWGMMSLTLGGTNYSIVLAGDANVDYTMCSVWNIDYCVKKAWFDTDGNFSDASAVSMGDNFTEELYLANLGPGPWEGVTIGNFSDISALNLMSRPVVDVESMDGSTPLFAFVNESLSGLDLDQNGELNGTFYLVVTDDRYDGVANLTSVIVDDDLNITREWWSDFKQNATYYEYSGNESGAISESRGDLPNSIWPGYIRFGNPAGEVDTSWNVETFNGTAMLLRKWRDWDNPFGVSDDVTLVMRAYNFDQSAISDANVSVERVMKFGFMGGSELSYGSDYTVSVTNDNKTLANGYVIVTLSPASQWDYGEYMVQVNIAQGALVERKTEWFRIGNKVF